MKKNCQISKKKEKNVSRYEIRSYRARGGPPIHNPLPHNHLRRYLVGFAVFINSVNVGLRNVSHAGVFTLDCNFPTDRNQLHIILQKIYLDIFDIARSYCTHGHYLHS